ncbi:MAG: hypothetical protein ACRC7N_04955 [Clostridium sp.]
MSNVQKAVMKLNDEINKSGNDYVNVVGEYLVDMLNDTEDEGIADKILADGKSIQGSLGEMEKEAKKIQKAGMACISPKRGFEIVCKYYGISNDTNLGKEKNKVVEVDFKKGNDKEINLDLDDLL